ncbi:MAG TPA: SusC/RagA family TonB-linked outer membrane protein, partial [Pedobacter sp.]|nr:SusC/RagA family TonB-linked outer membrane protein [Pedobacter sp.]
EKNVSIAKIFFEIRKQTGYDVLLETSKLKTSQKINAEFNNIPVKDVIDQIIKGTELEYTFNDKTIFIKQKEKSFFERMADRFHAIDVRGRIVDENSQPLSGATIKIKGTNLSTTSDAEGRFTLKGVTEDLSIQISYLGYKTREMKATAELGEIKMELGSSDLQEVTVSTGYFSTSKAKSTMNITKVDGEEINNQPVTSLINSLVGRVPGLDITPINGSPGDASQIEIRGRNSLNISQTRPLYIIDGVQIESAPLSESKISFTGIDPLNTISPADIESIEVLKDAGATAIYGSRGANGVIRITTKQARTGVKDNLSINVTRGGGKVANKVKLLNREQYLQMRHEAYDNIGVVPTADDFVTDITGVWDASRETDWQDVLLGGTANITDLYSSYTGGNANTAFKIGGGYHEETGVTPGDFNYRRANANFSLNHVSQNKKLEITAGLNFGSMKRTGINGEEFVTSALTLAPIAPKLYNEDGTLNWEIYGFLNGTFEYHTWTNPLSIILNKRSAESTSIITNGTIGYELLRGFKAKITASVSNIFDNQEHWNTIASIAPINRNDDPASMSIANNNRKSFMVEPQLIFSRDFNNHHFSSIIGATWQQSENDRKIKDADGFPSDNLLGSFNGAKTITSSLDEDNYYKYLSFYGHLSYDYKGRYLLGATVRRDGSSRFGPSKKFGNFGAITAGWIFSQENLLQNSTFFSFGKIRGSYGITGNDQIGDYQYLNTYSILPTGYQDGLSLKPSALFNPNYAWEVTKKLELGLEIGFFRNRVMIEGALYRNVSSNQLISYPLSASSGFESVLGNFDATIENKGLELIVTTHNIKKVNFQWTSTFNLSVPRNKLLKFDGIEESSFAEAYKVGQPLTVALALTYKGLNSQSGKYEFEDLNSDGNIDNRDLSLMDPLGRTSYYGLNNTFAYKRFNLSFLLQFSNNPIRFYLPNSIPGTVNIPIEFLDRWQKEGDNAKYQKFLPSDDDATYGNLINSNFNITDASFIRLKTLSVGYSFSDGLLKKVKLKEAKIYLQGQNIFTLSKFKGLDPETGNQLPPLKIINLGLQIKL